MNPEPQIRIVDCSSASGYFAEIALKGLPEEWYKDEHFWLNHSGYSQGRISYESWCNQVMVGCINIRLNSSDLKLIHDKMKEIEKKFTK